MANKKRMSLNFTKLMIAGMVVIPLLAFGQTPVIQWWFDTDDFSAGQTAAKDIDGDGFHELVFGCYRNDGYIYALNAEDGSLHWQYDASVPGGQGCNDTAPTIYDIDQDGQTEVIVPGSCNPRTFCFKGMDGTLKWTANTRGSDSPPTIADLDQDGKNEILHGQFGGYVICLNGEDGSEKWEILVDPNSWVQTAPTISDLDKDGQPDFVVATWNFDNLDSIFAYRGHDQSLLWSYPIHSHMYHGFAVSDLDNDGLPELLIGAYNDTLYCLNGEDGSLKWKYKGSGYIGAPVSIGDINGDGVCEIVFVHGSRVSALNGQGQLIWTYQIPNFGQAFRGVALADINKDAFPDVIFGTSRGVLIALDGQDGSGIMALNLADHYGNPLFALDHAPVISDFNKDGLLDIFIVGGYGTFPDIENNFGRAYMITIGEGNGPDWLMFQRDIRRQSSLCPYETTAVHTYDDPSGKHLILYPNPAGVQTTILMNDGSSFDAITIYNTWGQVVLSQVFQPTKEHALDLRQLPKGLYFVQIILEGGKSLNTRLFHD
jgi:outer membrane protein assembly factor BamB